VTARPKLSVLMPVYNERATVAEAIRRVLDAELPVDRELIVIDDGSTDGGAEVLATFQEPSVRVLTQPHNRGKGAAVRRGLAASSGDFIIIHDADLEYDPRDWPALLRPALEGDAVAVYGSRFTGERRNMMFWHWVGNRLISLVTNVLYDSTLSDVETCSKLIAGDLARSLPLSADGFDIDPEITALLLRAGVRIYEVPIRYVGREIYEGKKIRWHDGVTALSTLVRHRVEPNRIKPRRPRA